MKKILLLICLLVSLTSFGQVTINPNPFDVDESITITLDINSTATDCNGLSNPAKVYLHSGVGPTSNPWTYVVGNWGQDDGIGEMTNQGGGIWSITFVPETYYGLTSAQAASIVRMGMVFRNEDGTQELKASGCNDFFFDVGSFQMTLNSPSEDNTIISSGDDLSITATNIGGNANYELTANGVVIDTQNTSSYSFTHTNVTSNTNYELSATLNGTTITQTFSVLVNPGTLVDFMPSGLELGINYNPSDATKATLVLFAQGKNFIYVAGSFNNYQPDNSYAMKYDPSQNLFFLELTGLTPGQVETYQYWAVDTTPTSGSPNVVKTADPYSTLVLSPFDDPWISESTFPGLSSTYAYPIGQEREVTVLQTDQSEYAWQVPNFTKPKKEDLIIYEVLIRDFDSDRNFQDLIDRIDYFKNLNINAIELMPVMEFEGNESWGYNTSFHMALDKFYGTEEKFKEFIDLCHQNGIAVILDLAINHAFGRNPMVRLWMDDPDGDGWGGPASDNPYFNTVPMHSYNVGYDFNHSVSRTKDYTKRVVKHWIENFKIDGIRWDLTKGFTQNCSASNEGCTNSYQQDRVDVLKEYADYSWSLDPDHYVIFEHLGGDTEEQEWANYRYDEGKGVMMWSEMWYSYKELSNGTASDIERMGHTAHGFTGKRTLGYPESHDKDRIMYEMTTFGNGGSGFDLNTALNRMSSLGAITIPIPGPKMIWHFADLGMDDSIWTCTNGVVNSDYDNNNDGDCKLDTKPQPQWAENWLGDANRSQVYNDWKRLISLKINEDVFEGDYTINSGTLTPTIYIWDDTLPTTQLKNVVIISNFNTTSVNINPNFPYGGTWYDLMDESGNTTIDGNTTSVSLAAGDFRIYGNTLPTLSTETFQGLENLSVFPNPASTTFRINKNVSEVILYDITGKQVKSFKGDFNKNTTYNIQELDHSIYIIKIMDKSGNTHTTKLAKY